VVLGSRNVEVTKEIPLQVSHSPQMVLTGEIPDKVTFRLSGPKVFLRRVLDNREEPIQVNFEGTQPELLHHRFFSDNIRLPIGVKVLAVSPSSISARLERLVQRDLPVEWSLKGSPAPGLQILKAEVHPERIQVQGPESQVQRLSALSALPLEVSDWKESGTHPLRFDFAAYGLQPVGALPQLSVELSPLDANFKIKKVGIHILSAHRSQVEPRTVTVFVRASHAALKNLDRSQIFASVSLSDRPLGVYFEKIKVTLPKNMELIKVEPESVKVILLNP
jgi:YbbR domain-containing protein